MASSAVWWLFFFSSACGLALGGYLAGRYLARHKKLLTLYAVNTLGTATGSAGTVFFCCPCWAAARRTSWRRWATSPWA